MTWGYRIAILYGSFVALIITMVTMAMRQDFDLVSPDYYAKEIQFQDQIDRIDNSKNTAITYSIKENNIELIFPVGYSDKVLSGAVLFYKPSDALKDVQFQLRNNKDGKQIISCSKLGKGMYKMRITWQAENKKFYQEETIVLK